MKKLFFVALALLVSGCTASQMANMSGMPGYISDNVSSFDGQREISMHRAFIRQNKSASLGMNPTSIAVSALWTSTLPNDTILVDIGLDGTSSISIDNSLQFNVDGEQFQFSPIDKGITNIEVGGGTLQGNFSSRRFALKRSFIQKIINAKDVRVKLLLDKTYVTGFFNTDENWAGDAKPAFIEYLKRLPG